MEDIEVNTLLYARIPRSFQLAALSGGSVPGWSLCAGLTFCAVWVSSTFEEASANALAVTSVCGIMTLMALRYFENVVLTESVLLVLALAAYSCAVIHFVDASCVPCFLGCYAVAWRHALPFFSPHAASCILAGLVLSSSELVMTGMVFNNLTETWPVRTALMMIAWSILYSAVALRHFRQLWTLYDAQEQLSRERHIRESVISMLCDVQVVLDADGDTILSSTPQFDALAHRFKEGQKLSTLLEASPHAAGLRSAFKSVAQNRSPLLMPVTFASEVANNAAIAPSTSMQAELLIVCKDAKNPDAGFVVGVRTTPEGSNVHRSQNSQPEALQSVMNDIMDINSSDLVQASCEKSPADGQVSSTEKPPCESQVSTMDSATEIQVSTMDSTTEIHDEEALDQITPLKSVAGDRKCEIVVVFDPIGDEHRILELTANIFRKGLLPERDGLLKWFNNGSDFEKWLQVHTNAFIYETPCDTKKFFHAELKTTLSLALEYSYSAFCTIKFSAADKHRHEIENLSVVAIMRITRIRKVKTKVDE